MFLRSQPYDDPGSNLLMMKLRDSDTSVEFLIILAHFGGSCTRTKNKNSVRLNSQIFGSYNLDRFV